MSQWTGMDLGNFEARQSVPCGGRAGSEGRALPSAWRTEPGRTGGAWACMAGKEGVSQGTEWEATVGSVKAGGQSSMRMWTQTGPQAPPSPPVWCPAAAAGLGVLVGFGSSLCRRP